jgi:hypothetical protein
LGCALFAAACGGGPPLDEPQVDLGPPDLRVPHDLAHDLTPPPSVSVKGVIVDENGSPLPAFMSVCNPFICRSVDAASDGSFLIGGVQLLDFGVRSHDDITTSPVRGTVVRLLHPTEAGATLDAGMLFAPSMPAGAVLTGDPGTPQTLLVGDGLTLRLVGQDLEFPIGDPGTTIAARRIPAEHVPPYDLGAETLVADGGA